jgi:large subunit ribosomal protein L15
MELHNLKPNPGSTKSPKRIGRGEGSGHGGTSTRGHKGAQSRSGYKSKRNHEGGQTPLQMRVPKRGFNSPFRTEYRVLNLMELQHYAEKYNTTTLDMEFFRNHRIARKTDKIKILGNGSLLKDVTVHAHAASKTAIAAIEKAGGEFNLID